MTMQQVLYFLEVASVLSVSRAARRLYISQSALSQQIRRLEQELGYPLFSRTAHGIRLTAEGEAFCAEAAPVAEGWRALCSHAANSKAPEKIRLRLGVGSRVYSNHLFREVLSYFEADPHTEVTFVTEAGRDVLEALQSGALDLALDRLPSGSGSAGEGRFFSCELIRERQCVLMTRSDPRAALPAISFGDLQGSVMISGLEDSAEDRTLKELCRKYRITLNRIFRSDGIETNMRLVRDGMGVVLGPRSFAGYFGVAAVPLLPETWVSLRFICLKSNLRRPEITGFRDYLLDICRRRTSGEEA